MRQRLFAIDYDRLFGQMIVVSVTVHVVAFVAMLVLPGMFPSSQLDPSKAIEVDLTAQLPKGPGLGPMAPDRTLEAVRRSDARRMEDIQKERDQEYNADTVKLTGRKQVNTNKLGWRDQQRQSAVEKLRQKKRAAMEATGGGGAGEVSTTGILSIYKAKVKSQIIASWTLPGGLPQKYFDTQVYVLITIAPSGTIMSKVLTRSSGFEPLDRSCLSAVIKASPLPPPPSLLADDLRTKGILVRFNPKLKQH
ncbi:MAG TPA: TonB family protein [bacterium]|nr:TonB family protein [bacterium]